MARDARHALRLLCLPFACLVAAACGSTATPRDSERPPERDSLYLGLTVQDRESAAGAVQKALETRPSNRPLDWRSPSGASGSITPLRTFKIKTGHFCRDYREVVLRDDVSVTAVRRACRARDKLWRQVPTEPAG